MLPVPGRPVSVFLLVPVLLAAAGRSWAASGAGLEPQVQAYLDRHCVSCHGAEKQKADFRIDTLSTKVGFENTPQWLEIMDRISADEMPPKKEKDRSACRPVHGFVCDAMAAAAQGGDVPAGQEALPRLRRSMSFSERDALKAIAAASKAKDCRVRDIVEASVCSELFQRC